MNQMNLSKQQAKALKTWCKRLMIQYAASKGTEIGPAGTVRSLCRKGLIFEWGQKGLYKLTTSGIEELRDRGFFTPSIPVRGASDNQTD